MCGKEPEGGPRRLGLEGVVAAQAPVDEEGGNSAFMLAVVSKADANRNVRPGGFPLTPAFPRILLLFPGFRHR